MDVVVICNYTYEQFYYFGILFNKNVWKTHVLLVYYLLAGRTLFTKVFKNTKVWQVVSFKTAQRVFVLKIDSGAKWISTLNEEAKTLADICKKNSHKRGPPIFLIFFRISFSFSMQRWNLFVCYYYRLLIQKYAAQRSLKWTNLFIYFHFLYISVLNRIPCTSIYCFYFEA